MEKKLQLVGHSNPFGRYPNMVIPVGRFENSALIAVISDGNESLSLGAEWDYVEHDEVLSRKLASFNFSKDGLFALDKNNIEQFHFKEEKYFFNAKLKNLKFSNTDPLFRLALAKITKDSQTIIREILASILFVNDTLRIQDVVNQWYQHHLKSLNDIGLESIRLPNELEFLFINETEGNMINLGDYLSQLRSLNARARWLKQSIGGALKISSSFLEKKKYSQYLINMRKFYLPVKKANITPSKTKGWFESTNQDKSRFRTKSKNRSLRVFLCHASEDKPLVRKLYKQLSAESWIDPWLDEEKLLPGQDWNFEIEKAVESSDIVILLASNKLLAHQDYIRKELRQVLNIASEKPKGENFVIPLRLDDCALPRQLRNIEVLDYFPKHKQNTAFEELKINLKIRKDILGI